ncbi:MAG: efflux RND transporter periplasmic adaptor subunit [Candidatus Omnitrophica bacterium]|nr:efflux RND transporter periplasmic adaptor subunit [Candidatus Omnitrophota bacterium]
MKVSRFWLAAIMGIAIVGFGVIVLRTVQHRGPAAHPHSGKGIYHCPMHPTYTSDRPGDCPICSMKLVKRDTEPAESASMAKEKRILYWTDPMMPGYKSDKPGKSPMGMDLIPVYEEEVSSPPGGESSSPPGYSSIRVTPQKQQLIGVKTVTAERRRMVKTVRTVGRVAYDPELYQAQAEYLQALRMSQRADGLKEAARMRLRLLGLNEQFIDRMSEWDGADKRLLLADPEGGLWLYAPIYEFELPLVKVGQTVRIESPALAGRVLLGTIQSIDSVLDPATRSARVRALFSDPEKVLKPEMYVDASIQVDLGEVLSVPVEAVLDTGSRRIIFVDKGEGIFDPRDVTGGAKSEGFYEIKEGVVEGERVVVNGNFLIDSESRLKAALEGMSSSEEAHAGHQQHAH